MAETWGVMKDCKFILVGLLILKSSDPVDTKMLGVKGGTDGFSWFIWSFVGCEGTWELREECEESSFCTTTGTGELG